MSVQGSIASYLRKTYGASTVSKAMSRARRKTGMTSSQIRATAAQAVADKGRITQEQADKEVKRQTRIGEKAQRVAREQRIELETGIDVAVGGKRTSVSLDPMIKKAKRREAVQTQVIKDLEASAKRTQEKERAKAKSFEKTLEQMQITGTASLETALALKAIREAKDKERKVFDPEALEIQRSITLLKEIGVEPSMDFFTSTERARKFLLSKSEELRKLIPDKFSQELFIKTDPSLKFDGILKRAIENRKIIQEERLKAGITTKKGKVRQFVEGISSGAIRVPGTTEAAFEEDLIKQSRKNILENIGGSFKEAFGFVFGDELSKERSATEKLVAAGNPDFLFPVSEFAEEKIKDKKNVLFDFFKKQDDFDKIVFTKEYPYIVTVEKGGKGISPKDLIKLNNIELRQPSRSAASGLLMAGYSAASLWTNRIPVVGKVGTEIVDVGLAIPTYGQALINPTPFAKAAAQVELVDVAVDFIPFVSLPNINIDLRTPTPKVKVLKDNRFVETPIPEFDFSGGGLSKGDAPFSDPGDPTGGFGGIFALAVPLPAPSSFTAESRLSPTFDVNAGQNVQTESLLVVKPGVSVNILSELETQADVEPTSLADTSSNVTAQSLMESQVQSDFASNVSSNVDANVAVDVTTNVATDITSDLNLNTDLDANADFNLNIIMPRRKKRNKSVARAFAAVARVRGEDKVVARGRQELKVLNKGADYVDKNASASFVMKKQGEVISPKKIPKGFYQSGKRLIEKPSFRINSPGEVSQISRKGQAKLRTIGKGKKLSRRF